MIICRTRYTLAPSVLLAALIALTALASVGYCQAQASAPRQPQAQSAEVSRIIDRIIAGEKQYAQNLKEYSPRVETYLQCDRPDGDLGETVSKDAYFLGRLSIDNKPKEISFTSETKLQQMRDGFEAIATPFLSPDHFLSHLATSTMVDARNFDLQHYTFVPVGWEYVGDVRCLAVDVRPSFDNEVKGAFEGRIWVEDRNYAIVRLNGRRVNPPGFRSYTHFDSWRENLRPDQWLPVYIYSEDSDLRGKLRIKSNTRFWGYDLADHRQEEWTKISVESPAPVHDSSDAGSDLSPVEAKRQLEMQAEHNVLERLEKARLIAPAGPVDKVLETVLNNLVVTNHLDNLPPLHCRVMLTAPLESFSLRFTIVLSRGLIDVLPDEPSLAMVLAHELAHVALGHKLDTKYAFNDRLFSSDEETLATLDLARSKQEEAAADAKALEFLKNSPYADKLGNAGLFLRAAAAAAPTMPHLFGPHLGNGLVPRRGEAIRMAALMSGAPAIQPAKIDQLAALPLGSRMQVNAWEGTVTFPNRKAVPLLDPGEKMPFLVSPLFPHLTRYEGMNTTKVAAR